MLTANNSKRRFLALQGLRFIAFIFVLLDHASILKIGGLGVSIFIILSGFLMGYRYFYSNLKISFTSALKFSINKILKLYPLYLFVLIIAILTNVLDGGVLVDGTYILKLFLTIFMLQAFVPLSSFYFGLLGILWYMSTLLFLYFVFPFLIFFIKKIKNYFFFIVETFLIMIIYSIIVNLISPYINNKDFASWATYIFPVFRVGDFFIGCLLGAYLLNRKVKGHSFLISSLLELSTVFLVVLYIYFEYMDKWLFGNKAISSTIIYLPCSLLAIYVFASEGGLISKILALKPIVYLGDISGYSYLLHPSMLALSAFILNKFIPKLSGRIANFILALILVIIASAIYDLFNKYIIFRKPLKSKKRI